MGRCLLSNCTGPSRRFRTTDRAAEVQSIFGCNGGSLMEHVVFSAAESGAGEEFRRVSSLEEAVRVVEHLRNDLGVTESSVFALTPVPLEFKTYYRVEVPSLVQSPPIAPPPASELPEL